MILGALVLFFALAWLLCRRLSFYSLVDVFWAFAFLPVVILQGAGAGGWVPRRVLLASLMGLWSLRLTLHLGLRLAAHFPHEDRRYVALREAKGVRWPLWSFVFFRDRALWSGGCVGPSPESVLRPSRPGPGLRSWDLQRLRSPSLVRALRICSWPVGGAPTRASSVAKDCGLGVGTPTTFSRSCCGWRSR